MKKLLIVSIIFLASNIIFNLAGIYFFSTKNFGSCEKAFLIANFGLPSLSQAKCAFGEKEFSKSLQILNDYKLENFEKYGLMGDIENILASSSGFDENLGKKAVLDYQKSFGIKKDKIFESNYNILISKFEKNTDSSGQNSAPNQENISQTIQQAQKRIENQASSENIQNDEQFVIDKDGYILLENY